MLSVRDALGQCLATAASPSGEDVPLEEAHGRVLLRTVVSSVPLPPWSNSAMDGFALQASSGGKPGGAAQASNCDAQPDGSRGGPWLDVVGTVPAGHAPDFTVGPGQAARVMTGALIPEGADSVVMQEQTTRVGDQIQLHAGVEVGQNIRWQGEDLSAGSPVLEPGTTLNGSHLGLAAAVGVRELCVARRPTVGIIATGDELVEAPTPLTPGTIYSSNTAALMGLVREAGATPIDCGVARDSLVSTREAFERAMACDIILSTGGVSVGDFDVVREAMESVGAEMQFWRVAMKPGKPLALGIVGDTPTIGLPGNPVSCQVGFLQFVRPWLRVAMGCTTPFLPVVHASLAAPFSKRPGRAEFVRVRLERVTSGWSATPLAGQGSGSQTSMATAQGLMMVAAETISLAAGDTVSVQALSAGLIGQRDPGYPWS